MKKWLLQVLAIIGLLVGTAALPGCVIEDDNGNGEAEEVEIED